MTETNDRDHWSSPSPRNRLRGQRFRPMHDSVCQSPRRRGRATLLPGAKLEVDQVRWHRNLPPRFALSPTRVRPIRLYGKRRSIVNGGRTGASTSVDRARSAAAYPAHPTRQVTDTWSSYRARRSFALQGSLGGATIDALEFERELINASTNRRVTVGKAVLFAVPREEDAPARIDGLAVTLPGATQSASMTPAPTVGRLQAQTFVANLQVPDQTEQAGWTLSIAAATASTFRQTAQDILVLPHYTVRDVTT
jgi:hypothetical protein